MKNIFIIILSFIVTNIVFSEDLNIQEDDGLTLQIIKSDKDKFTYISEDIFNIKKGCEYKTICELLIKELALEGYPHSVGGESVVGSGKICFIHDNYLVFINELKFTFSHYTELLVNISYSEIKFLDNTKINLNKIKNQHQELAKKRALKKTPPDPWYGESRYKYMQYQSVLHSIVRKKSTKEGIIWTLGPVPKIEFKSDVNQ